MYATCIHCQRALGRNELLETLPVGRRIAFDEAAGRVWVVCQSCCRWNLVPFDSRYEAIEASEKLFRESRLRMSTGQIGIAKTREGTELVRIGSPLRPEMAAWRYAGSLAKRRMRFAFRTAPVTIGLAAVAKNLPFLYSFVGVGSLPLIGASIVSSTVVGWANRRTLAIVDVHGAPLKVNRLLVGGIRIDPQGPTGIRVLLPTIPATRFRRSGFGAPSTQSRVGHVLAADDDDADRLQRFVPLDGDLSQLLRVIMPISNEAGAPERVIADATAMLSRYDPDPRLMLFGRRKDWSKAKRMSLADVSEPRRLALEMLVHEESERRWLAGELQSLEAEWVRAAEIAAIADGLGRDPEIESRLSTLQAYRRNLPESSA
jgi:hypothetical protein